MKMKILTDFHIYINVPLRCEIHVSIVNFEQVNAGWEQWLGEKLKSDKTEPTF